MTLTGSASEEKKITQEEAIKQEEDNVHEESITIGQPQDVDPASPLNLQHYWKGVKKIIMN